MLSSWLVDVMIRHWGNHKCQFLNDKMIGWPSIKRHDNVEVGFDRFDVLIRHWGMQQCLKLGDGWSIMDVWYIMGCFELI